MVPERTELEWVYHPADLFEVAYRHVEIEWKLVIESGRAVTTLSAPQAVASQAS